MIDVEAIRKLCEAATQPSHLHIRPLADSLAQLLEAYERIRSGIASAAGKLQRGSAGFTGIADSNAEVIDGFYRGVIAVVLEELHALASTTGRGE